MTRLDPEWYAFDEAEAETIWRRTLHPDDPLYLPAEPEPPNRQQPAQHLNGLIDWDTFWQQDRTEQDWLIEPILARGRSHALYAPAKAGKSLLALEVAAAAATGRTVLNQPAGPPLTVMYVDLEMTEDDLHERLTDLGYGPEDKLTDLHYYLLPDLPPLDTPHGGNAVVGEARRIGAHLVVVDTVARAISGAENDADTIASLARYTFTPLKRAGITSLRCDHSGKDLGKGQRGTSAKNDDVDVVWQLTVADNGVTMRATHRRLSWIPEVVMLTRTADPLTHQCADNVWPPGTGDMARRLDDADIPLHASVRTARAMLKTADPAQPVGQQSVLVAGLKWRRHRDSEPVTPPVTPWDEMQSPESVTPKNPASDLPVTLAVTVRNSGADGGVTELPPKGVTVTPSQPDDPWKDEEF